MLKFASSFNDQNRVHSRASRQSFAVVTFICISLVAMTS